LASFAYLQAALQKRAELDSETIPCFPQFFQLLLRLSKVPLCLASGLTHHKVSFFPGIGHYFLCGLLRKYQRVIQSSLDVSVPPDLSFQTFNLLFSPTVLCQ